MRSLSHFPYNSSSLAVCIYNNEGKKNICIEYNACSCSVGDSVSACVPAALKTLSSSATHHFLSEERMKGRGVAHCADKTLPGVSLITALIRRSRALLWGRGGLTFSATICAQTSACLGGIAVISSACADLRPAKGCVGETPLRKRWSQVRSETIYMQFNHVQLRRASAPQGVSAARILTPEKHLHVSPTRGQKNRVKQ